MGMLDLQSIFSDQQTLAMAAGSALSTYSVDTGVPGAVPQGGQALDDIGRGEDCEVLAKITQTVVGAGASVQFQLVMADDPALSVNLTVLQETLAIPVATLVAGYRVRLNDFPAGISQRYVGMRYIVSGATTTA